MPGPQLVIEVLEGSFQNCEAELKEKIGGFPYLYCVVTSSARDIKLKTSVAKKTLTPQWNECFKLDVGDNNSLGDLLIGVYHSRLVGGHDLLGQVSINQISLPTNGFTTASTPTTNTVRNTSPRANSQPSMETKEPWTNFQLYLGVDHWHQLILPRAKQMPNISEKAVGKIRLRFKVIGESTAPPTQPQTASEHAPPEGSPFVRGQQGQALLLPQVQQQLQQQLQKNTNKRIRKEQAQQLKDHLSQNGSDEVSQDNQRGQDGEPDDSEQEDDIDNVDDQLSPRSPGDDSLDIEKDGPKSPTKRKRSNKRGLRRQQREQKLQLTTDTPPHQPTSVPSQISPPSQRSRPPPPSYPLPPPPVHYQDPNPSPRASSTKSNTTNPSSSTGSLPAYTAVGSIRSGNYADVVVTQVPVRELQKTFAETVTPDILQSIDKTEKQRQEVILEFINTERDYVRDLQILISVYIEGMREQKILSSQDLDSLFTSIEQLLPVHLDIMKALEARRNENPIIMNLGDILLERIPPMNVYATVCSNQPSIVGKIERFSQRIKGFKFFLEETILRPEVRALSLMSFLIKPLQRITRYPLLLKEILKHTNSTHPDFTGLTELLGRMMNLVDHVNEATRRAEQEMKIFDLQGILDKGEELRLVQDKRVLIREGPIKLLRMGGSGSLKKLECYSFLLDHMLIFAGSEAIKKKSNYGYSALQPTDGESKDKDKERDKEKEKEFKYYVIGAVQLSDLMMSESFFEKGLIALELIHLGEAIFSVCFETPEERSLWVGDIEHATQQYMKQLAKKDIADLPHLELLTPNEVDSLLFKRPIFNKDLTLALTTAQNLGVTPSMPRVGSFSGDSGKNGLNLNLNMHFGKSSKHKHENVEQTKLYTLEKALRKDLDAFCKALRGQVLELLASKRHLEQELQTTKPMADQSKKTQRALEAKIDDLNNDLNSLLVRLEHEGFKRTTAENKLQELQFQLDTAKNKVSSLETKLVAALQTNVFPSSSRIALSYIAQQHARNTDSTRAPTAVTSITPEDEFALLELQKELESITNSPSPSPSMSLAPKSFGASAYTKQAAENLPEMPPTPDLLEKMGKGNVTKLDTKAKSTTPTLAKVAPVKQGSQRTLRPQSSQTKLIQTPQQTKPFTHTAPAAKPAIPPKPQQKTSPKPSVPPKPSTLPKPVIPPKPSIPPKPLVPPRPSVPPKPSLFSNNTSESSTSTTTTPTSLSKLPVPQKPTPPTPQRPQDPKTKTLKTTPLAKPKHPVPQKPTPPTPQKPITVTKSSPARSSTRLSTVNLKPGPSSPRTPVPVPDIQSESPIALPHILETNVNNPLPNIPIDQTANINHTTTPLKLPSPSASPVRTMSYRDALTPPVDPDTDTTSDTSSAPPTTSPRASTTSVKTNSAPTSRSTPAKPSAPTTATAKPAQNRLSRQITKPPVPSRFTTTTTARAPKLPPNTKLNTTSPPTEAPQNTGEPSYKNSAVKLAPKKEKPIPIVKKKGVSK